jgi:hypothetical protein
VPALCAISTLDLTDSSTFMAERRNMPKPEMQLRGGAIFADPHHTLYLTDPTTGAATAPGSRWIPATAP